MIWTNDKITLYNADCFDIFPQIADKSVDLILADLPYGTTACKWDTILPFDKLWQAYERIIKDNGAIVLTASQPFTSALIMSNPKIYRYNWAWEKRPTGFLNAKKMPMKNIEDISIFYKIQPNYNPQGTKSVEIQRKNDKSKINKTEKGVASHNGGRLKNNYIQSQTNYPKQLIKFINETGFHPTQKPVALMEYLIKTYTNEGDLVLDNTFGSGTTAVACQNLNRHFVGMEKEKKYFDIAVQRLIA